jgi:hypothetical protein
MSAPNSAAGPDLCASRCDAAVPQDSLSPDDARGNVRPRPAINGLADRHFEDLRKSGLTTAAIAASGIFSAPAEFVRDAVGIDAGPGMVIPYEGAKLTNGRPFLRVKPDRPFEVEPGKFAKYLSPPKQLNPEGNRLYVPRALDPRALRERQRPLIVTEGEKKILAALAAGFEGVALAGVWSWRKRDEEKKAAPIADLYLVDWTERTVFIVFDSDAAFNPEVQRAERALRDELRRRGAKAFIIRLPEPTYDEAQIHGTKFGLDDFLVARGAAELRALLERARKTLPLGAQSASALLAEAEPDEPWLIEGIWPEAGCGFIAGEPKTKKSFLALLLAYVVVAGRSFFGREVRRGPVILIDEENDRRELKKRMRRVAAGLGVEAGQDDIVVAAPAIFKLDDDTAVEELDRLMTEVRPALVLLDPLVRLHGGDENDAGTVAPLLGRLRALSRKHRCAVIVVHHLRKRGDGKPPSHGQRMRGSSDLHGWLDSAIYTEADGGAIKLSFECRYAVAPEPIHVRMSDTADAVVWSVAEAPAEEAEDDPVMRVRAILARQTETLTREQIKGASGLGDTRLKTALATLTANGELEIGEMPTGGKKAKTYRLSSAGTSSSSNQPLRGETTTKKIDDLVDDREELPRPPYPLRAEVDDEEGRDDGDAS